MKSQSLLVAIGAVALLLGVAIAACASDKAAVVVTMASSVSHVTGTSTTHLTPGNTGSNAGVEGISLDYPIVDTGQTVCYGDALVIDVPSPATAFYGQDAQHDGSQPDYASSDDGLTVVDNVTGLTWQRTPDIDGDGSISVVDKLTWAEAQAYPDRLNAKKSGGYDDWRLPSIKELYSLIVFSGVEPMPTAADSSGSHPFIATNYFAFAYGDTSAGERVIDAQYISSTRYVATTMRGSETVFGVNFADGRIKGYGVTMPGGREKTFFVLCVRGNPEYGTNELIDNGDGTVTDEATGLMWSKTDTGEGLDWRGALAWVQAKNDEKYLGYDDWRLPNAKELQSIVDYARSPDTTGSAAIDPLLTCTSITNEAGQPDYPCYWTSTTHVGPQDRGVNAVYVAFGRCLGYLDGAWLDVHGAGAQRSDPKVGDPGDYPAGHGPQGDAIRIYNHVRAVRDAG